MGGVLADPAVNLPGIFGEGAILGFQWIRDYPYSLPSLLNCLFLSLATAATFLFLEEVSPISKPTASCACTGAPRPSEWENMSY